MMRVLLDTNILISYLLNRGFASPIAKIVEAGILGEFTLLLPEALLNEFADKVATKPYLSKRIASDEYARFSDNLERYGEIIPKISGLIPTVTRDPKDDYLLAYAVGFVKFVNRAYNTATY